MEQTTNYGLGKPLEDELYDIAVQNTNMDKIDANLKSVSNTANSASSNISTHTSNKSNPHEVTKAQLGLGNVPNVTTNNQTPSYTVPSSLSALVSGEILQTAFGKIAKAVDDLISHLANKSNPHAVTKLQVGLSNVPNVATNDQTPTYSDTTTLATLVSGEKLNVSMQKIKFAITTLINHISNVSNPHSVTKSQIGLGSVDNTADSSKVVASAGKLTTARTIALTGDVTGSASFDGSGNISIATSSSGGTTYTLTLDSYYHTLVSGSIVKMGKVVFVTARFNNSMNLSSSVSYPFIINFPSELLPPTGCAFLGSSNSGKLFYVTRKDSNLMIQPKDESISPNTNMYFTAEYITQ